MRIGGSAIGGPLNRRDRHKNMSETKAKRVVSVRAYRGQDPGEEERDWASATPEERMNAVWELTKLCLLWNAQGQDAQRLQRSIVRIQRSSRCALPHRHTDTSPSGTHPKQGVPLCQRQRQVHASAAASASPWPESFEPRTHATAPSVESNPDTILSRPMYLAPTL